ncbi:MAG: Fic family protein [Nanoarchaeota archaeon]
MVSIVAKRIKGNEYLYLIDSVRENGKVVQKTLKYIGRKRPVPKEEFACMKLSAKGEDWILLNTEDTLSYQDHLEMKTLSDKRKAYLKQLDKLSQEKERERFLAMFIANSNAIEGSTVTVQETFNYLFHDVAPAGKSRKELYMASNLLTAYAYVEKNCTRIPMEKDMRILHKLVNKDIEDEETLGKHKNIQNYIGDVYTTSYLYVKERMAMLFSWIQKAYKTLNDFEVAFQSHAQFELIHPFVDGNGRVGRLLLNWLLMHKKLAPLAIKLKRRNEYLSALRNAQQGNPRAICQFCFEEYKEQYRFAA